MATSEELEKIVTFLDLRFGLDTLWLFGSEAAGTARKDSDLDLAALFRRRASTLEIFDARGDLGEILRRDVDLIDLDQASPILGMQVLRYGRLLVDRNPKRRYAFFSCTISMYDDLKIVRRQAEQALFARMNNGRP
jgi:predicted nucleotidyltransferase